jgi:hypothetical protein
MLFLKSLGRAYEKISGASLIAALYFAFGIVVILFGLFCFLIAFQWAIRPSVIRPSHTTPRQPQHTQDLQLALYAFS